MSIFNVVSVFLLAFIAGSNVESQLVTENAACEGYTLNLSCPTGYLINIIYSNYGRRLPGCLICPKPLQDWYTLCSSTNSTTIMSSRCNDRNSCAVAASNSVFGDPCPGTYKYLKASAQCIKYERACEGNSLTITCPAGQTITVLNANFGRTLPGTEVCQYTDPNATTNTNCAAANSTQTASSSCNGRSTCTLQASNTVFGDPCPGTYKYLQVTYYCS